DSKNAWTQFALIFEQFLKSPISLSIDGPTLPPTSSSLSVELGSLGCPSSLPVAHPHHISLPPASSQVQTVRYSFSSAVEGAGGRRRHSGHGSIDELTSRTSTSMSIQSLSGTSLLCARRISGIVQVERTISLRSKSVITQHILATTPLRAGDFHLIVSDCDGNVAQAIATGVSSSLLFPGAKILLSSAECICVGTGTLPTKSILSLSVSPSSQFLGGRVKSSIQREICLFNPMLGATSTDLRLHELRRIVEKSRSVCRGDGIRDEDVPGEIQRLDIELKQLIDGQIPGGYPQATFIAPSRVGLCNVRPLVLRLFCGPQSVFSISETELNETHRVSSDALRRRLLEYCVRFNASDGEVYTICAECVRSIIGIEEEEWEGLGDNEKQEAMDRLKSVLLDRDVRTTGAKDEQEEGGDDQEDDDKEDTKSSTSE
ncbi:hypothetical protein ADUPG1_011090, partial [Aduncisulcus paluster]